MNRLTLLTVASCNCGVKSPETKYHENCCHYRGHAEAADRIEADAARITALEAEVLRLREGVNAAGFHVMAGELQGVLDATLEGRTKEGLTTNDDSHVTVAHFMGLKIYTLKAWIESLRRAAAAMEGK